MISPRLLLIICLLLCHGGTTRGNEENAAAPENASAAEAAGGVRQIIGHRGSMADRPENTLAAIGRAIEVGATAAEIDVRSTADGRLVLLHDATLDRTTDGSGPVAKKALAEVQKLDAGSRFDSRFRGERVPMLEEALAVCRDRIDVVLDLKEQGEDYDRAVAETVRAAGDPRRTIVGVRSVEQAKRFRKLLPESRQLGFIPGTEAIEAFAEAGCETIRLWPKWLDQQRQAGRSEYDLVRRVRESGAMLHLNVASAEREEVLRLLEHRPDSLLADDPGKLVKTLQQLQPRRTHLDPR